VAFDLNGSSQFGHINAVSISGAPITIFAWFSTNVELVGKTMLYLTDSNDNVHYICLFATSHNRIYWIDGNGKESKLLSIIRGNR